MDVSALGSRVVSYLLDAVDGASGSAELVGYFSGDVSWVAVVGGRMAVLVEASWVRRSKALP